MKYTVVRKRTQIEILELDDCNTAATAMRRAELNGKDFKPLLPNTGEWAYEVTPA
jgi:hypothetical protein